MWIESMNSFKIQCNTKGLQIDKAGMNTNFQSQKNETNDLHMKTCMTPASQLASSTSCALFWMNWSWLGISGEGVRPDTDYDLAKQKQLKSRTTISGRNN